MFLTLLRSRGIGITHTCTLIDLGSPFIRPTTQAVARGRAYDKRAGRAEQQPADRQEAGRQAGAACAERGVPSLPLEPCFASFRSRGQRWRGRARPRAGAVPPQQLTRRPTRRHQCLASRGVLRGHSGGECVSVTQVVCMGWPRRRDRRPPPGRAYAPSRQRT